MACEFHGPVILQSWSPRILTTTLSLDLCLFCISLRYLCHFKSGPIENRIPMPGAYSPRSVFQMHNACRSECYPEHVSSRIYAKLLCGEGKALSIRKQISTSPFETRKNNFKKYCKVVQVEMNLFCWVVDAPALRANFPKQGLLRCNESNLTIPCSDLCFCFPFLASSTICPKQAHRSPHAEAFGHKCTTHAVANAFHKCFAGKGRSCAFACRFLEGRFGNSARNVKKCKQKHRSEFAHDFLTYVSFAA